MKKVSIVYNPYKLSTKIEIDEKKPTPESSLNVGTRRLQEWVDRLPKILVDECRDNDFLIKFTGTQVDFGDLVESFEYYKKSHESLSFGFVSSFDEKGSGTFIKKADVADVEKEISEIFNEIQNGKVDELKDQRIIDAFEKAKNQQFEINVVATMSAGKSTLINALLRNRLMPAKQEATTNTIVRIIDDKDKKNFSAKTYDKDGGLLQELEEVSFTEMDQINSDPNVSFVELHGPIPFVSSTGMKLALVDTPGPNNSRDSRHRQITYEMFKNSEKSLVLYVMNSTQAGTDGEIGEKGVLRQIYETMKDTGKQGRERYIFAVNKMDEYKPGAEGHGCIQKALDNVKKDLEGFGIFDPNIFPVCALPALQLITNDNEPDELDRFKKNVIDRGYDCMHFDKYYNFSHLPLSSKIAIDAGLAAADDEGKILIHTGIKSIEEAIKQYINKYARTIKVKDLVFSFNGTLKQLATVEKLKKAISEDQGAESNLLKQIKVIRGKIDSAEQAKKVNSIIDDAKYGEKAVEEITKLLTDYRKQISDYISSQPQNVKKEKALSDCKKIERKYQAMLGEINARINTIIDESFKNALMEILINYRDHLSQLKIDIEKDGCSISAIDLVESDLDFLSLSDIIDNNTDDQGRYVHVGPVIRHRSESQKVWYKPWTWFKPRKEYDEIVEEAKDVWEHDYVVNMGNIAFIYLAPILENLDLNEKIVKKYIDSEMKKLKSYLKTELKKIKNLLDEKYSDLERTENEQKVTAEEIKRKEEKLEWLEGIQKRVDNLVEF